MDDGHGMKKIEVIASTELSECDREELHHIGRIQGGQTGHALFFSSNKHGFTIFAADQEISSVDFILHNDDDDDDDNSNNNNNNNNTNNNNKILGLPLQAILPGELYQDLVAVVLDMQETLSQRAFHFYQYNNKSYALSLSALNTDTTSHNNNKNYDEFGLEVEELDHTETHEKFYNTTTSLARVMESYTNESSIKAACDAVFHLLGDYDRGMVYRFNDDLSGQVIHEIKHDFVETSYVGLRFPASDIPLPARRLYIKNGLRYIHGTDFDSIPILCTEDHQHRQVDLSQCRMRAVAKPHVIYLQNMGVVCSMSLAIVVEGELWGLLAFHGYTRPFKPSLHQRIACETISTLLSVRVEALMKKQESARIIKLGEYMMNLNQEQSVLHNLYEWGEAVLEVLDAEVLIGYMQDSREGEGDQIVLGDKSLVPAASFWQKMFQFQNRELCVISTRREMESRGLEEAECPPCGIVYFRESRMHILVGRKERSRDVVWAGNPDEPKLRIGGILNPRASFDQFMEKARMEARAWTTQDINVITALRDRLCDHAKNYMMNLLTHDIEHTNQKYLNAMDRARDNYEFFAHMSHELRTPFHGVMGCLNILHDSVDHMSKEEVMDTLQTAISSGNHMLNLLNDILDISKNKHLSHECTKDNVIFQSFAFEAIDGMKTLAQSRDVRLDCVIQPKEGKDVVITDRTKVIQIVSNIVNNAIKFTSEGGIDVAFDLVSSLQASIKLWATKANGHRGVVFMMNKGETLNDVKSVIAQFDGCPEDDVAKKWFNISVSDSGCGMDPTQLADMFAPYTQASTASNRAFQGTGLGLCICLSLCEQLQGFIACSSTPGEGTTFHIAFPVEICEDNKEDRHELSPVSSVHGSEIVMKGPIMIVDDNKVNVKILQRQFQLQFIKTNREFPVVTAVGGQEAIDRYREARPSLCIIDYHMPEIDGLAATSEIRKFEKESEVSAAHIICYTADATEKAVEIIMEAGCDEIMSKPPPKGFMEALVRRLVNAVDEPHLL